MRIRTLFLFILFASTWSQAATNRFGTVVANNFIGDGSALTGVQAGASTNGISVGTFPGSGLLLSSNGNPTVITGSIDTNNIGVQGAKVIGAVAQATHSTNADFSTTAGNGTNGLASGAFTTVGTAASSNATAFYLNSNPSNYISSLDGAQPTNANLTAWGTNNPSTYTNGLANLVGATFSGPVLTSSSSSNSPAANELASAGWIRNLFNSGVLDYTTTNIDATATNGLMSAGQSIYTFAGAIPLPATRTWASAFVTNGGYIGHVITTNTFTFLQGPVTVNSYIGATTAGPIGNYFLTIHPEIYYSYDKTNWFGDYDCQNQSVTGNATNLYQFVISFPAITSTNQTGFYIMRCFKVATASTAGNVPTVYFLVGTNSVSGTANASHISLSGPSSAEGNAFLSNNQTFTGVNTFSTIQGPLQIWNTSDRTNGSYSASWGQVHSNASGGILLSGGSITAKSLLLTNTGTSTIIGDGSGLTNLAGVNITGSLTNSVTCAYFLPYTLTFTGVTNLLINPANGNYQAITLTTNAYIGLPPGAANMGNSVAVDIMATNFSVALWSSNVANYGQFTYTANTTNSTTLLFWKPYQSTNWTVKQLQ